MKTPTLYLHRLYRLLVLGVVSLAATPVDAALNETNRRLLRMENQFDRLRSHADLLGFRQDPDLVPLAKGGLDRTSTHFQGIARSSTPGRPYLFVTRAGMSDNDRGYLMIVRMGSRNSVGERLRSNRYEKSDSVEGTQPPAEDRVVRALVFSRYQHPGGIQLCGDILAVPLEGVIGDGPKGKVMFYDVSDPENPRLLPGTIESTSKIGIVGLTHLPDGKFLLVTTGGDGGTLKFYRSNRESFLDDGFAFRLHDTFDVDDVRDGTWDKGTTSHQALQLMVQRDTDGVESVYLIAGHNDRETTPFISGKDMLFLYKVTGWEANADRIGIREITSRQMHTDSGNSANGELGAKVGEPSSYHTDSNGNFLAGLCTYVSPTGELLVYAVEHYNWGPRASVRFAEFRHEQVYREGNPIYEKQALLYAPEFITEDSTAILDAGDSQRMGPIRPWVEIFEDANYNGRSVIMDWADRDLEDFKDLRKLSWPDGFNDRASSVRWFAPMGWTIRLYDGDNYRVEDDEPYLDLFGIGVQSGIRVLSDKPYEFDNTSYDGVLHETRVTSLKFIPPGYFDNLNPFENPIEVPDDPGTETADDGWSKPKEHLRYSWRLLDQNMNPVSPAWATLTPVAGSPWLASLQTFARGVEVLNAELTIGPAPFQSVVRPIRFLKRNRTPVIGNVLATVALAQVTLDVEVKDEDSRDEIDLTVTWGDLSKPERIRGRDGQRSFTLSHVFTNPDPESLLASFFSIQVQAQDSAGATSELDEKALRIQWRENRPPLAGVDSFQRAVRSGFKTRIQTLLRNDAEPDGDYFAFTGVTSVFPEGATVAEDDGWLLYSPAVGSEHLPGGFNYSVRDQFGSTSTGRVVIEIQGANTSPSLNLIHIRKRDGGGVTVEFQGIPRQSYEIYVASTVAGPWAPLARVTADATGRIRLDDPNAGDGRFYRTQLLAF